MRFFLFLFFFGTATTLNAQSKSVLSAEATRFAAQSARDTASLRSFLHEDLLYIHSNGLEESRSDFLENVASGKIEYRIMEIVPNSQRVVRTGRNSRLVQGIVRVAGTYEDKPFDIRLRYTSVYQRRKRQWQLLTWQSLKLE